MNADIIPRHDAQQHNGSSDPCDAIRGPCACGAWHHDGERIVDPLKAPITPEEFTRRMQAIADDYDIESGHREADGFLADVLDSLGYGDGIAIYRKLSKWYA